MTPFTIRLAVTADLEPLRAVMDAAIGELQAGFLSPEQVESSRAVMGLDRQLVEDATYFVVESDGAIAGCGGWSRRATLYGGDHSAGLREPRLLDPATEPARIRAMYTVPAFARRGVGRALLAHCEAAAQAVADLDAARNLVGGRVASVAFAGVPDLRLEGRAYWAHELADTAAVIRSMAEVVCR